ncbi:MAG: DUF1998 domain-containing protein [Myxococcales bacterium]|nr:DUF1998 domain-containing protein [Myxococcales bacterium]
MSGKRRRWSKAGQEPPAGEVRRSQLITTYGAGAMIDLVHRSALVGGLDYWNYPAARTQIHEPRLAARLVAQLRKQGVNLNPQATLFAPPDCDDDDPSPRAGLQVLEFPRWMVCQGCSAMVQASSALTLKDGRYQHACASGKQSLLVPVRFVVVCPSGHLDEFPWVDFVHFGREGDCRSHALTLREDAGAELFDVRVSCQACSASKSMAEAQRLDTWLRCKGTRPWLGRAAEVAEVCTAEPRMKVRTSSSTYFSQVQSALSIPNTAARLERAVRKHLPSLAEATADSLAMTLKFNPPARADLGGFRIDQVWTTLEAVRRNETPPPPPLRPAEYEYVQGVPFEKPGDAPDEEEEAAHFFARRLHPRAPLPAGIERVVLVRKLREVRAQIGFTRLAPAEANLDGDIMAGKVKTAMLGHLTDWLPAIEEHGEGLWIQLDTQALDAWEQRAEVQARAQVLRAGWNRELGDLPDQPFFGPRYYFLHALSHLLIQAISLECGYGASALRERIYCSAPGATTSMAAILLSTTTPGSEGTLGGLVAQGRNIGEHLARALELGRLCSNDPVCARHTPAQDPAEQHLEGAACHGCLYLAEVSCERMNRMLDRALVVPVIDQPSALAFFADQG